jgi:glutamate synthase (NADPH/NADH) small chain
MGKITGFIEYDRVTAHYRPIEERLSDYRDVSLQLPEAELQRQGARCMDCGIPYCHALGCPVYNLIPEWNDAVYKGKWREAYERLTLTNSLPEITGRVCPAPCESSCTLGINSAPVSIKQLELAIIERAFAEGWVTPQPPLRETNRTIAIIGSGPSGLSAAQQLRRMGHRVTVFEKSPRIGGILRYGIPDFKLEKWVIDRRVAQLIAEGVEFETNALIGEDISAGYLRRRYNVILMTKGAGHPRDLHVPGRGLDGIHFAMDYLTQSNKFVNGELKENQIISAKNKTVLVIGGGDTGSDCVGTANRQGAAKVYQFEILPKPREWSQPWNPQWPEWPSILRTSSSHAEGCERDWSVVTKQFNSRSVKVEAGHFTRVAWETPAGGGRPKMVELPGSEFTLKLDLVLLAMGFEHVLHGRLITDLNLQLDERENIKTNSRYMTSLNGVFAAGDAETGASLVVRAIWHGRQAAEAIGEYLK